MAKTEAIQHLCKHALKTLPQSIKERDTVLRAVVNLLPKNSAAITHVREMLFLLEKHQELQAELPGLFTK